MVMSRPISSSGHRRRRFHFQKGSSVEVRTNEKGLKAVYFSATVVSPPPPPPSAPASSGKNSRKLLYVEFHNLVTEENGSEKLRERVDVSFVRPAPPALQEEDESARAFQPGDVVDAFYNDGWWMGVVSEVVEDGERVVVVFQDPPDVREFRVSEIRAHWDWVDEVWMKKQSISFRNSMFGEGKSIEISIDDRCYGDAWIPAIVHRNLENGNLLVEYDSGEDVIVEVDVQNARPCPLVPINDERKYSLYEEVDAYVDHVWRSGVIKEELENGGYVVLMRKTKLDEEFSRWDLRPHMEWKDGKWLLSSVLDAGVLDAKLPSEKKRRLPLVDGLQDGHDHGFVVDVESSAAALPTVTRKTRSVLARKINRTLATSRGETVTESIGVQIQDSIGVEMVKGNELDEVLPFVKDRKTGVWETIEALPVFQKFPQKPHFKPLEHVEERLREGRAISCMISFSRLVEKASNLRVTDPKGDVDEIMVELGKMEEYGFDAGLVKDKLTRLLDLKVDLVKLVDEANRIRSSVSEHLLERGRIEAERRELLEKLLGVESAKDKKDSEIASLQDGLEVIEESIKNVGCDYEGIICSIL